MVYCIDTNTMWRRFDPGDPRHPVVKATVDALLRQCEALIVGAQNLIEFQAFATRPVNVNGLGLSPIEAMQKARAMEAFFTFLPDTGDIYPMWRTLVNSYEVKGKQVHDTRLVAFMLAHGVTHLLTLNPADFQRFHEITVVEPHDRLRATVS